MVETASRLLPERCGCPGKWQTYPVPPVLKPHGACENQEAISFHRSQEIPKNGQHKRPLQSPRTFARVLGSKSLVGMSSKSLYNIFVSFTIIVQKT